MKENFFALKLILRFGTIGAVVLAVLAGVGTLSLLLPIIGLAALLAALAAGGLMFLLCKSYVELVSIVFQMVH